MSKFDELKEKCYQSNIELKNIGLVIFTFGNVSAVDRKDGVFAIKPSGVPYEQMSPGDMVVVDFNNQVVEGTLRPSSDTKTHSLLYKTWDHIGGIAHTHSPYAVAWSQAQKDIPILGTTHADMLAFDIPCSPEMTNDMIKGNYEHETGNQIINCFNERKLSPAEVEMILVANHGPFTWGKDSLMAVHNIAMLEEIARIAWITLQIDPKSPRLKKALIEKHYQRKHGDKAYYGQN